MKCIYVDLFACMACFLLLSACTDKDTSVPEQLLKITPDSLSISSAGGIAEFSVKATSAWYVEMIEGGEWCNYKLAERDANIIVVSAYANGTGEELTAKLLFKSGTKEQTVTITQPTSFIVTPSIVYPQVESDIPLSALTDELGNIIPDFSHIGYMGSEVSIPEVTTVMTIEAPAGGTDMTEILQNAIDAVSSISPINGFRGAIMLKQGTYPIKGTLKIKSSGIVLRGEGEATKLVATGARKRNLIEFEGDGSLNPSSPADYNITDKYVPVGRFWVRVKNPSFFKVGDDVVIYRPAIQKWISDLKMDQIPPAEDGTPSNQWLIKDYNLISERRITAKLGDTLHFDNPIMMAIDNEYGGGAVYKASFPGRINQCGIENMLIESEYKSDTDNDHGWVAIAMKKVEHSWIRNVTSRYFGNGLMVLDNNTRFVTVKDCECLDAKSVIEGGTRYSFSINNAQQCLVIDCQTTEGRHDCVTGPWCVGPNAFVRVVSRNTHGDIGPHHRWNVGTLYDNIDTDGQINVQDRGNLGAGHGWAGANQVLWNCTGEKICVQNPWVSAKNYSIGTKGTKYNGYLSNRPDGVWVRQNETVTPLSLFDAQLELRKREGRLYHIQGN